MLVAGVSSRRTEAIVENAVDKEPWLRVVVGGSANLRRGDGLGSKAELVRSSDPGKMPCG